MKLIVGGHTISNFENVNVTLMYNSVVSTFQFDVYFNPYDPTHRAIFLPFSYQECEVVTNNGERIIKGYLYSPKFTSSSVKQLTPITGCSLAGTLRDCNYFLDDAGTPIYAPQMQFTGKSLADITDTITQALGLPLAIDNNVLEDARKTYDHDIDVASDTPVLAYLSQLCSERNIILSHTQSGAVLLTRAVDAQPVFDFSGKSPDYMVELSCNGQEMHSTITILEQGAAQTSINNPYVIPRNQPQYNNNDRQETLDQQTHKHPEVSHKNSFVMATDRKRLLIGPAYRPTAVIKRTGSDSAITANAELAKELKAIILTITIKGWQLPKTNANGQTTYVLFRPNTYITVKDPDLYLFQRTKFFIESAVYNATPKGETCVLTCVVPEVYNGKPPINIFTNQPAPIETEKGVGSALPLGFNGFNNFVDL